MVFTEASFLQRIHDGAFADTLLEKFSGPRDLWDLGPMAFFGCERLRSVKMQRTPENIDWSVFAGTQVNEVRLPMRLGKRVPVSAVRLCDLETIEFPAGLEVIRAAWRGQVQARCVKIPASVRRIEAGAFEGCTRLEKVFFDLDSTFEEVEERCFCGSGIRVISLPYSVKWLGARAFAGCAHLEELVLPKELRKLGEECFCVAGLTRVKIPKAVREIAAGAFYLCTRLREVTIAEGSKLEQVGPRAFGGSPLSPGDVCFPGRVYVDDWVFAGPLV